MSRKMANERSDPKTADVRAGAEDTRDRRPEERRPTLFDDADRLWETFAERFGFNDPWSVSPFGGSRAKQWNRRPRMDIAERDDDLVVTAEVPGLKSSDLDISVTNDVLTLRAKQSREEETDEGNFHRREIVHGSFVRRVRLPCTVDAEHASATYENGLLRMTLPKTNQERTRKIPLKDTT